jgi:hypothetical protein
MWIQREGVAVMLMEQLVSTALGTCVEEVYTIPTVPWCILRVCA